MRYALYFTPPQDDPLTIEAARWLGRDAFSGETFPSPDDPTLPAQRQQELTADPRRYGFHATIKAPFELAGSVTEEDLLTAVEDFAAATPSFAIPEVSLSRLGRFFALVPAFEHRPLQAFAEAVVRAFEPFRAELSQDDIARRKPDQLSESQRAHLLRWGYPYVMEDFRFHMTLSGQVPADIADRFGALLHRRFDRFAGRPLAISSIAVFCEEHRGADFKVRQWLPLTGA